MVESEFLESGVRRSGRPRGCLASGLDLHCLLIGFETHEMRGGGASRSHCQPGGMAVQRPLLLCAGRVLFEAWRRPEVGLAGM